ncbi:MAG: TetR/AcrR family transcriptional regulator [Thermomicrobiales bacterium]
MTTISQPRRTRRQLFSDEQVFLAITRLLIAGGIVSVSLPAIAQRIGYTHQALTYRFASRAGLLQAYSSWFWKEGRKVHLSIRESSLTPLSALRSSFLMLPDPDDMVAQESDSPSSYASLLIEFQRDPILRKSFEDYLPKHLAFLTEGVQAAQDHGELRREYEPSEIVRVLIYAVNGAAAYNTEVPVDDPSSRMKWAFDVSIRPYLASNESEL